MDETEKMIRVVRSQLADGRTPDQIAASVRDVAEWYIELAWRMGHEDDRKYGLIRSYFPDPRRDHATVANDDQ